MIALLCPCATPVGHSISYVLGWLTLAAVVIATVLVGLRARRHAARGDRESERDQR